MKTEIKLRNRIKEALKMMLERKELLSKTIANRGNRKVVLMSRRETFNQKQMKVWMKGEKIVIEIKETYGIEPHELSTDKLIDDYIEYYGNSVWDIIWDLETYAEDLAWKVIDKRNKERREEELIEKHGYAPSRLYKIKL